MIASPDKTSIDAAIKWVRDLTAEPEVGKIYEDCRVVSVLDFGAFVEILPGQEGLVHISRLPLKQGERVNKIIKIGEIIQVKVINIDDQGRIDLTPKA